MTNSNSCFFLLFLFFRVESGAQGRGDVLRELSFGRVEMIFLNVRLLDIIRVWCAHHLYTFIRLEESCLTIFLKVFFAASREII